MADRVVIDGAEVSLSSQIDGSETSLSRNIDGGEIGESFVPLPQISIGEVETLEPNEEATATMTGTASRPVLNLGLVKGQKGDKGDKGDAGSLDSVSATIDANVGTPSVDVVYDGANAQFNFHNLKGIQGERGPQGETGPQGPQGDPATNLVQSVNGKQGIVVLGASDVGALPSSTVIPTKTSQLANDSGYVDTQDATSLADEEINNYMHSSANVAIISTWGEGNAALVTVEGDPIGFQDFYTEYSQNGKILVAWMIGEVSFIMFDVTAASAATGTVQLSSIVDEILYVVHLTDSGNGLVGTYSSSSVHMPTKVSDLTNDSGYITSAQAPVQSVNGQTGTVNITIPTVPTNVSAFTNDSGYVTSATAPVKSVNGDTGTVVLDASDVGALPSNTVYALGASAGGNAVKANGILYGTVDSTSTSTNFTVQIPGVTSYYDGLTIMLHNGIVTSAANFVININSLGGKPVYNNMAAGNSTTPTAPTRDTTIFNLNYTMLFTYSSTIVDGGGWICYRGYDANTNTIGYQLRTNSTAMTVTDTARYCKLYFTSANGNQWVPASVNSTNNTTSARPVNQRPIDPFGRIVYMAASTNFSSGATLTATAIWDQYTLALGYSFNRTGAALTMTSKKPVYVKCAPQSNGSAIMDADTPIVQDLPSTDDGKIYIFLGAAYSATNIELFPNHPVYHFKNGAVRLWTGATVPTKTSELTNDSGYLTLATLPIWDGSTTT